MSRVAVVGSINQDLIARVPRRPDAGETILGHEHFTGPGGKGANQAVAAARLGAHVAFVGSVGDDPPGREMLAALRDAGVDVTAVEVLAGVGTGLAVILLDDDAENAIVVSPGANRRVDADQVRRSEELLSSAEVTLIQLEIPIDAVEAAATLAGHRLILNPAPARPLSAELLGIVDVLVPNQTELGLLAGVPRPDTLDETLTAARTLSVPGAIVVTMGARGALVVAGGAAEHVPAPEVTAVDTTGAGDAFCGALAQSLAVGADLPDAVDRAVHAGAAATTSLGAQSSLPTRSDLESLMSGR